MSRRSLYKQGRSHSTLYGPKTEATVVHWKFDWIELATTREEEAEGPQRANTFKVKTWVKIPNEEFAPLDDGVPNDILRPNNQMQAAADEIANKEATELDAIRGPSEAEVKSEPATVKLMPEPLDSAAPTHVT